MKNIFFQKLLLSTFVVILVSIFFSPINYAQAACSPPVDSVSISAAPATVSNGKPSLAIKVTANNLTDCDVTTSKNVHIIVKVDNTTVKLADFSLGDYVAKFQGKTQYVFEKTVNVIQTTSINKYKNFTIRPGIVISGKETLNFNSQFIVTNSSANNAAPVKATTTQDAPIEEKVDESGRSGFVICGNTVDTPCNVAHLFRAFIIIINYLITMAGFVAVFFIVIAGVQMTASQGQEMHKQAIQRLSGAIIGLVLVALAFVLVNSLLAGSLNLGIKQGGTILTSPRNYIKGN